MNNMHTWKNCYICGKEMGKEPAKYKLPLSPLLSQYLSPLSSHLHGHRVVEGIAQFCQECGNVVQREVDKQAPFDGYDTAKEFFIKTVEGMKKEREAGNHGQ